MTYGNLVIIEKTSSPISI